MQTIKIFAVAAALISSSAQAQNNPAINDFNATSFDDCVMGRDIGKLTGVSNPMLLLGSLAYIGKVMKYDGSLGDGWVRQTMSLPIVTAESVTPDVTTCTKRFETTADGSINVLGLSIGANRADVYNVTVRLIARQSVSPVPVGTTLVPPWYSERYRPAFETVMKSAPNTVVDFFVFDNISIYLLEVQKFQRINSGLSGAIGLITGGGTYKKLEDFKGVKLIVTGDAVHLNKTSYSAAVPVQAAIPAVVAQPAQAVQVLSPAEATNVRSRVVEAATPIP